MASAQISTEQLARYAQQASEYFTNRLARKNYDLLYITENANWAIRTIGADITGNLATSQVLRAAVATSFLGAQSPIVHFGSPHVLSGLGLRRELQRAAAHIVTIYHLKEDSDMPVRLNALIDDIDLIHTSCQSTRQQLIKAGLPPQKLRVLPLGVDARIFKPGVTTQQKEVRRKLNIPENSIVIGSFQKDGEGWEAGLIPKYIKGPDILVDVLRELSRTYPIHVLLSGPARGFVTNLLDQKGISYTHVGYVDSLHEIASLYHALDIYLITSRLEGGPKQILEAWASGIPVVTASVGMIPDIAIHKQTAMIAAADAHALAQAVCELIENPDQRFHLSAMALKIIPRFGWDKLAQQYYTELYKPFLEQ